MAVKVFYNASNMNVFFGTLTLSNSVHYTDTFYTTAGVKTEVAIYCEVRTPPQDFGTLNLKTQSRLGIDYYKLNNYASSITFNIDWTDYGIVDSSSSSSNTSVSVAYTTYFPFVYQLGSFRKRSYRIGFTTDGAIRLNGIECSINKGQR